MKGLHLGSWRTRNITIRVTNLLDKNSANISNQVKFIDTIKYYQQSLAVLAGTMTDQEGLSIKKESKKFMRKDTKLNEKFKKWSVEDQEWVLNYLSTGKGIIH